MLSLKMFLILVVIGLSINVIAKADMQKLPKLLVVSYDAFRYDYFDRNVTPFLKHLKDSGTTADYMINVFTTKTFPNHHTICTGYYVENHGVVDSQYISENSTTKNGYSYDLYHYNNNIIPIWTMNEKVGNLRHSGVMMWPGSEFPYQGINATFRMPFNHSVPFMTRIDRMISWFNDPKTPINFGMLYIEEPDYHGHGIGINGNRFNKELEKLDNITKYLHKKLAENNLSDVNVIHLSDHGMSTVTLKTIVNLTSYINSSDYDYAGVSPVLNIYPKPGKHKSIYDNLKKAAEETQKFDVYLKKDLPERFHYTNNERIGPIIVVAKVGYSFETIYSSFEWYKKEFNITIDENSEFGLHGYDNSDDRMHPFFLAIGPAFSEKCKIQPFENINLFPLFCEVLNLNCPEVNGTAKEFQSCLTKYQYESNLYWSIYIGGIIISLSGIIILYLVHKRAKRRKNNNPDYRILITEAALEDQSWND